VDNEVAVLPQKKTRTSAPMRAANATIVALPMQICDEAGAST